MPPLRLVERRRFLDSYGFVLMLIVVTYIVAVTLTQPWGATIVLAVQIAAVTVTLHVSHARRLVRVVAIVALVLSGIAALGNLIQPSDDSLLPILFACSTLLYVVAPFSIVRHVAMRQRIDVETFLGALAAYLLLGMAFAFSYTFIGDVQATPFFGEATGDGTVSENLFFSFITLTTTGYGNLVPAQNPGQSLAVLEALLGQLFLVTAVAKIVSAWQPRRREAPTSTDE
jgi:Ion channel